MNSLMVVCICFLQPISCSVHTYLTFILLLSSKRFRNLLMLHCLKWLSMDNNQWKLCTLISLWPIKLDRGSNCRTWYLGWFMSVLLVHLRHLISLSDCYSNCSFRTFFNRVGRASLFIYYRWRHGHAAAVVMLLWS